MTDFSYQLYCSRNWDLNDALGMLSAAGYTQVEGYGGIITSTGAAALRAKLDANGLSMTSSHLGLADCEADPAKAVADAQTLGIKKAFIPHVGPDDRPTDAAGWQAFGARLATLGQHFTDAGMVFGWHNHDFECVEVDGIMPLDAIADHIDLELDLGWVGRAGHNPVDWINKYGSKIKAAHIKDIAPAGECLDEDGWADVGHGTMDWAAIHAALQANGVTHYVTEHDKPSDHARFAQRSLASMQSF
jgi:sugar phosphate isomerase/epimerase